MTQLEQEVLDIINEVIEGKYIGKLKVLVEDNMYQLFIYFDRNYVPTILAYEGTEDEFKKFVRKEFKKNRYERVKFWRMDRELLDLEEIYNDDE